ncbi:MAG: response regulator [Candidatus Acidiferrales bacterium]
MPHTILVADQNHEMRSKVRSLLEGAGWQVIAEAADGQEVVDKAQQLTPDLVILDLSMPTKNGLEISAEVLALLPRTKILIFTIHEAEEIKKEAFRAGVHGYALKSASGAELIQQVKSLLE